MPLCNSDEGKRLPHQRQRDGIHIHAALATRPLRESHSHFHDRTLAGITSALPCCLAAPCVEAGWSPLRAGAQSAQLRRARRPAGAQQPRLAGNSRALPRTEALARSEARSARCLAAGIRGLSRLKPRRASATAEHHVACTRSLRIARRWQCEERTRSQAEVGTCKNKHEEQTPSQYLLTGVRCVDLHQEVLHTAQQLSHSATLWPSTSTWMLMSRWDNGPTSPQHHKRVWGHVCDCLNSMVGAATRLV